MNVFVTNRSGKEFEDGFAGARYCFAPGRTVEIPEEVARHIFGYRDPDKVPYLVRLGWIETRNDLPAGIERLAKFDISETGTHRSLSPAVEQVPLTPRRQGGKPVHQPA